MLGGDRLVRHAATLSAAYRVPKTVVGAVILGFGTSLPELGVSLDAAFRGSPDIAIANVVGSNVANVGLILGFGALLTTLRLERRIMRVDLPFGVLAALFLLLWVGPQGQVSRMTGIVLLLGFAFYLRSSLLYTKSQRDGAKSVGEKRPLYDGLWIAAGLATIGVGAHLMVTGAVGVAHEFGVTERVIGLTVVAIGTSLPELAATYAAARNDEADLAVGNIVGSNLFNLLFVLGTTAVVHPVAVDPAIAERDFPVVAVFAVLAFPMLVRERRIGRRQGVVLILAYAAYITWTCWGARG